MSQRDASQHVMGAGGQYPCDGIGQIEHRERREVGEYKQDPQDAEGDRSHQRGDHSGSRPSQAAHNTATYLHQAAAWLTEIPLNGRTLLSDDNTKNFYLIYIDKP